MTHFEITNVTYSINRTILRERALSIQITGNVRGGAKSYFHEEDGSYYYDFYPKLYSSQYSSTPLIAFPIRWIPQSNPSILNNQQMRFVITITLPETLDNTNNTNSYWLGITDKPGDNPSLGKIGPWYAKPEIILRNQRTGIDISASRPTTYGQNYTVPALPDYRGYLKPAYWYDAFHDSLWSPGSQITINQSRFSDHNEPLILSAKYDTPITYPITLYNNAGATLSSSSYTIKENSSATITIDARNITAGYQITGTPVAERGREYPDGGDDVFITKHQLSNIYYLNIPMESFGDIDINMKISPITYSISYEGYTVGHTNPPTRNVLTAKITLKVPSARNGYTFDGWYTEYTHINKITEIPLGYIGNRTLYAKWNLITYTVTIDENGGQGVSDMSYTIETPGITLPEAVRNGYTFTGYSRTFGPIGGNPSISGNTLTFNGSYGDITVKMNWSIINYDISYTGDTSGLSGLITSFNIDDLTLTLDKPTRTGYTVGFNNYTISTIGNKVITITQTPYNLSIIFNQASVVSDIEGSMTNQVVPYNDSFNLESNNFTAPGYLFAGWLKDNEGELIPNQADRTPLSYDVLLNTGNVAVELYAQWNMINYTISYTDNTTGLIFNKTSFNVEELDDEDYHIVLDIPTRTGYTVEFDEPVIETIGDKTIVVKQYVVVYTITFNSQDGSAISTIQYNIEQSVNLTDIIPVREGYTFNGWFTSATGGTKVTSYPVGTIGDKVLYAQWSINSYNITFRNKYDSVDVILKTYSVEYNSTISAELFDGAIPSRPNIGNITFTFIGWNTNSNETNPLSDLGTVPVVGKTFYAIYSYKLKGLRKGSSNVAFALGNTLLDNVALGDNIIWEKDDE